MPPTPPSGAARAGDVYCWRTNGIPKQAFAFAADGIFDGHAYSRRVTGIDFQNAVWLRLGVVNDLSLDMAARTATSSACSATAARLRSSGAGSSGCRIS